MSLLRVVVRYRHTMGRRPLVPVTLLQSGRTPVSVKVVSFGTVHVKGLIRIIQGCPKGMSESLIAHVE